MTRKSIEMARPSRQFNVNFQNRELGHFFGITHLIFGQIQIHYGHFFLKKISLWFM